MSDLFGGAADGYSRRDVLRFGVTGAFALTASGLLAACGPGGTPSANPSVSAGPPKKGGTLTVGLLTGGQTETVDVWKAFALNDYARVINLYDALFEYDEKLNVGPSLAESGVVSPDGKVWTIKLRSGVTFHDGSPLTADDVIYNVRQWMEPNALFYAQAGSALDPKALKKIDDRTVEMGLLQADRGFKGILAYLWGGIKSRNEKKGGPPIGTGPFKYVSFQPGSRSEFERFPNHWRSDPVYLDRLVMNSSFTDENARTQALQSGAVDILPQVSFALAKTFQGGNTSLLRSPSAAFQNFTMRLDAPPFDDVRVRQAMRLLVDRKAMVQSVYAGFGQVSSDVPGQGLPLFDKSLVRERDVDQAKSLLKQAGKENLTVTLQTSTALDGLVQAATLFKQQAKDAGVTVNIQQVDPASYFDPTTYYSKMVFAQTAYFPVPSLPFVWASSYMTNTTSNETHWYTSPDYKRSQTLWAQAKATNDDSTRQELWHELQKEQFDSGGYLNWGTYDFVDALSNRIKGLTPSKFMNCSGYNFRKAWLSS